MVMLKRRRVLAAKVETTPGTAESLSGTEGTYNAYDVVIQPEMTVDEREKQGTFASLPGVAGARAGKATFKIDLGDWDGTASLPTWATVLLAGCGYVNSSGTLTPRSEAPGSNVKTLTIGCYIDGKRKLLAGAAGTFKIMFPAGRKIVLDFEFRGVYQDESDTALIAPTYPTGLPLRFAGATVQLNDVNLAVESVTFDAANELKLLESAATAAGYSHCLVVARAPKLTINPETVLASTQNRWAIWRDATELAFELDVPGPGTSVFTLDCDKSQIVNIQEGDRGKVVVDQIDLRANASGTDADVKLVFTASV